MLPRSRNSSIRKIKPTLPKPTRNKSWRPGQKGQGGEGMSKGYGSSGGKGTGPSGPETGRTEVSGQSTKR
jgi:hypothetical protein